MMENDFYKYRVELVRVIDGDTMVFNIDLGYNIKMKRKIRLYGINTPETYGVKKESEEYKKGKEATMIVEELLSHAKEIWIESYKDKAGKYGRYLATVYLVQNSSLEAINLNKKLLEEGYARTY